MTNRFKYALILLILLMYYKLFYCKTENLQNTVSKTYKISWTKPINYKNGTTISTGDISKLRYEIQYDIINGTNSTTHGFGEPISTLNKEITHDLNVGDYITNIKVKSYFDGNETNNTITEAEADVRTSTVTQTNLNEINVPEGVSGINIEETIVTHYLLYILGNLFFQSDGSEILVDNNSNLVNITEDNVKNYFNTNNNEIIFKKDNQWKHTTFSSPDMFTTTATEDTNNNGSQFYIQTTNQSFAQQLTQQYNAIAFLTYQT